MPMNLDSSCPSLATDLIEGSKIRHNQYLHHEQSIDEQPSCELQSPPRDSLPIEEFILKTQYPRAMELRAKEIQKQKSMSSKYESSRNSIVYNPNISMESFQEPDLTGDGSDYKYGFYDTAKKDELCLDTNRIHDPQPLQMLSTSTEKSKKSKNEIRTNNDMAALSVWMQKQAISLSHMSDG